MNNLDKKGKSITRRNIISVLGTSLLIPFIGFSKSENKEIFDSLNTSDDDYKILLKSDGTTVKVKANTVKNSKIVKKNISNSSLLNWLGKQR